MGKGRTQTAESISTDGNQRMINKQVQRKACGLSRATIGAVLALIVIVQSSATLIAQTNVQNGKALFERRCGGCHELDGDHEGPRLRGVMGRAAGSVKTFQYSKSLENAKFMWDEKNLDKWLADTESVVPDNDMAFRVPKQEERTAIIGYLKSLSAH
jgi:cytochrome c